MLEFLQYAALWQLFQFAGEIMWFIVLAVLFGIVGGIYSLFCMIRNRMN